MDFYSSRNELQVKQKEAQAFVDTVMSRKEEGVPLGIDPHLLAGNNSGVFLASIQQVAYHCKIIVVSTLNACLGVSAEWIAAALAVIGGSAANSVVIAANASTVMVWTLAS